MLTPRTITLALLILVPVLVYLGLGAYALWQTGLFRWTWWIIPGCWGLTWLIAWLWRPRPASEAADDGQPPPEHWTPRDEAAAGIVREFQEQVDEYSPQELTDPHFYLARAQELADRLARHYHPQATNPVSSLTVPEVLAAVRLAVDDMERWMLESVPGSQLITIGQWRWLGKAPKWVKRVQNTAWAASILINPANLVKFFSSKLALSPVTKELQAEFLAAVYLRFIRQVGFYLIEMNSGRLRGGADRYRRTFGKLPDRSADGAETPESEESVAPAPLTVALVGQVKAGKSSLANALIGERVAESDVLPATRNVARYRFTLPDANVPLTLLDTPGYADAGATKSQLEQVRQAVREADVVLLVIDAHAPARAADRQLLDELLAWYADRPELKLPPVVVCLTHIDLLSPAMEWEPPYEWRDPQGKKARSIHEAVAFGRETFPDCAAVVPVCTDVERNRTAHIVEDLLPALLEVISTGQSAALLRAYHRDLSADRVRTVLRQIKRGGKELWKLWKDNG
jgi:uncharacterized protein